jgi:hypothetical protein
MATPALSANWHYFSGPASKASVTTAVTAATVANLSSLDAPAVTLTADAYVAEQFAAAQTAALAMLAAMTGSAPNAKVDIWGYSNPVTASPMSAARGCQLEVLVVEVWP